MHPRSIGKRIRMDEPPPPEYDTSNPMTPMTPMDGSMADSQEPPYTPYTPYSNQSTPMHAGVDVYGGNQQYEPANNYEQQQHHLYEQQQQYEVQQQQQQYEAQLQQQELQQEPVQPPPEPMQESHDMSFEAPPQYEQPMTPLNLRGGRITRARLRNATQPNNPPPPPTPVRRQPAEERTTPGRKGRKRSYAETINDEDSSLYLIVRNGRSSLQTIVDDWIEAYKINRDTALVALMQFFIHAAGCKGKITAQMAASMEHAAIIRKMTEEFDEESGEYPLIMSGQQWKKFRQNFCDFVAMLVKQCQYSIIYDQYLMDNVISLLTGLSDSQVRAFRHTATLAAMKLMTALVDVALTVSINLDNTQRQYEAERQKARDKRASDRLESLMAKRQELEENMDEIKNMLTYMFKSVFVHRYRDTLPEIRSICMAEIGVWMKKFHQNFLDDSYLKYIGWTLHDKVGEVRLKCLQALQPLYASEELKGKLELFTSKFKDRIVAMTLDKEYDVAVQAVRLVISILKNHRDILTDKDCEHVYELVYSSHRAVAQAAGEFLNERLFVPEDAGNIVRTKRGKKRLPNTPLIRDLVQFFIESELHEHGAYLVDSLIESNDMMKDWECMTDLLLEEPGPHEEPLDDRQETSLIELMVCCVRQAATGEAPVGRGPNRKIPSVKEIKQVQDDKQRLTEHFIATLPPLIDKYRADPDKLANLISIPQYFDLEIYTTSRQEANLDLLLKKLHQVVEKHHDTDVLETCAKTLEVLCTEGNAIYTRCDVQRSTLIDAIVNRYKEAMDEWNCLIEGAETPDDDETFNVVNSLKKVAIFYSCHNIGSWNIWSTMFKDVVEAKDGNRTLPEEAVKYCMSACYFGILWDLHHLEELAESGADACKEVKQKLTQFFDCMKEMLTMESNQLYKEEAYITICDLLVVFCNQLFTNPNPLLGDLVYEADKSLQTMLNVFIQNNVFVYQEEDEHSKIEELHKRRNFLASYCKLIVYSIMPTSCAADVFKHYVKSYMDYGDIIKTTLGKAREINKTNCARTMLTSLISLFREMHKELGHLRINRQIEEFSCLKELAKRFALSFGLDAIKNREAITALHREGILFAVERADYVEDPTGPPPNLAFLEILTEFTNKLLKQDKRIVLNYLDRRVAAGMPSSRGEDWQPLLMYRNSLVHGETDQPLVTSKRAYYRKKKEAEDEVDEIDDASDQEFSMGHLPPLLEDSTKPTKKRRRGPMPRIDFTGVLKDAEEEQHHHMTITSTRPQRQCARFAFSYVERDDDEESMIM
ncbi:cohesin subunit SA-2 isoform X2 [Macrosteles quadrilineatus]|uniref:cohesin subunit SA-2 isoform X2 n=1 Tax=Macrosteles quadrilineatus TaxID=74068 RepID=UPI0023E0A84A|nr:cohesin subunit SA-2 isoform X2 [Macrosteles quadrilineatus]